jgi:hypothetical protein
MTKVTKYMCDVCGAMFADSEQCYQHEASHKIQGLFEIKGAKFYANGKQVSASQFKSLDASLNAIDAIEVSDSDTATEINDFYVDNNYNKPFEDVNSKRVYFDDPFSDWIDADRAIENIKSYFGEE